MHRSKGTAVAESGKDTCEPILDDNVLCNCVLQDLEELQSEHICHPFVAAVIRGKNGTVYWCIISVNTDKELLVAIFDEILSESWISEMYAS